MSDMTIYQDRIGKKYGRLTIIGIVGKDSHYRLTVKCCCECGTIKDIRHDSLTSGKTTSCNCVQKEKAKKQFFVHGYHCDYKRAPEYSAWISAKKRCHRESNPQYKDYGARGIIMCDEWRDPKEGFLNFINYMGEKPEPKNLYSLDRINNDGNYEPGNCRWATHTEQALNKRKPIKNIEKHCKNCKSSYLCIPHRASRSKYCSGKCGNAARLITGRKRNKT